MKVNAKISGQASINPEELVGTPEYRRQVEVLKDFKPELKVKGAGQAYIETEDLVKTPQYRRQIAAVRWIRKMRERDRK